MTPTENYVDTRVSYSDEALLVTLQIIDERLWYSPKPVADDFVDWDAAGLYLTLDGNAGGAPDENSYYFIAQLSHWQPRAEYQAAYRGNGSDWAPAPIGFKSESGWRGSGFNEGAVARGWNVTFKIPFASLGLPSPPAVGAEWGLSLIVHDRDDAAGTSIPEARWPENADPLQPATWGRLRFGLPGYEPPFATHVRQVTIRQGLNNVVVLDAHVGGHTVCGSDALPDYFEQWGSLNYAGYKQINIQNQLDVADWPCFSKFYVTFPLDSLPAGKAIVSAQLALNQFGNSGQGSNPGPEPSFIQVLTLADEWDEQTITWNNAPMAVENVAGAWVDPVDGSDGVSRVWDVSRAVADAYGAGQTLRLVLYSAGGPQHSGKYFWSSDADEWAAEKRPTLQVRLGDLAEPQHWLYLPLNTRH